jgi:hypothetical protein
MPASGWNKEISPIAPINFEVLTHFVSPDSLSVKSDNFIICILVLFARAHIVDVGDDIDKLYAVT